VDGPARIGVFAVLLVAVFAGAALLGGAVDPSGSDAGEGHGERQAMDGGDHEDAASGHADEAAGGHGKAGGHAGEATGAPPGLQVAERGYRLVLDRARLSEAKVAARLEFRIVDDSGRPVRQFELEHERRMHFIVVRRDLTSFQHLHPEMRPDGTWVARADLSAGGVYRAFADFKREGEQRTLGADLHVGGPYRPAALPGPEATTRLAGGLEVTLRGEGARPGQSGRVEFEVRDRGEIVNDRLQPYLGARGHLVALREGDLAYLHTHPEGDELAFMTEYPSAGAYRLFVQFLYRGKIRTAAFTQEVGR